MRNGILFGRDRAMRSKGYLFATLCLAASLSGSCYQAGAQAPDGGVLRVNSRLVVLDVTVLDKQGNVVSNLTRDDFRLYENGEPQSIRNFETFSAHRLPDNLTAASINSTGELQRVAPNAPVTVLVLDEFNTDFSDTAFARQQIRRYLLAQGARLPQPTSFLVATDEGFSQVVDYTLNRDRLLDGLAHLPAVLPGLMMRTGNSSEGKSLRFAQTLSSLQQVASASIGHPGRKNIIWIGRGFDSIDLRNEGDHQVQIVKGAAERAVDALKQAHAVVYTVDPTLATKLPDPINSTGPDSDPNNFAAETHAASDPFDGTVSFNTIAPQTGGRSFALFNDLDNEIGRSVTEGSSYYTLAYVPDHAIDAAHPYRQTDVKLTRPGLIAVARKGYYTVVPPLPPRAPRQELKAQGFDIGTALSSGMTYTGLGVTVAISKTAASTCVVQVNTKDIQWTSGEDGSNSAHLTLVAIALDGKGKPLAKSAKDISAKLGADRNLADIPWTTLQIALPQSDKVKSYRIAVRDVSSGKMGTGELSASAR